MKVVPYLLHHQMCGLGILPSPTSTKTQIHLIFYVSILKPFHKKQEGLRRAIATSFNKDVDYIVAERVIQIRGVPN